jgi:geranylgeranyl reductase family protein
MSQIPDYDVIIVGGGPAGSAAAIVCAAADLSVAIVDRQTFPRDKPCGDGVTPRAVAMLDLLGVGGEARQQFHHFDGFRVRTPSRSMRRPLPHKRAGLPSYGLVARRTQLDSMLLERARGLGASVLDDTRISRLVWSGDKVIGVVATDKSRDYELYGRIVIGADGATSRVAQALGVEDRSTIFGFALRAEMQSPSPIGDSSTLEIFPRLTVDGRSIPGYGWVFPMGGGAVNVGVGVVSPKDSCKIPFRKLQGDLFAQIPEEWELDNWEQARWKGWKLLMGLGRTPIWRPGVLLAGDAAAAARPTSGAGISKALRSGFLAGMTCVSAIQEGSTDDLSDYERTMRRELGRTYLIGRAFVKAIARPWVFRAALSAGTVDAGARLLEDLCTDVVGTDSVVKDNRRIQP